MSLEMITYLKYLLPILTILVFRRIFSRKHEQDSKKGLKGKVVLITGASAGIGEAIAHKFYEHGCKVILAARRENQLERVKKDLMNKKVSGETLEPIVLTLDLAESSRIEDFVKNVYEKCGHIDILVNNSGVLARGSILHTKMSVEREVMEVNYFGTVALTKAVLPKMVERRCGHILFVSSVQGLIAVPDFAVYGCSKHALQAFGDALRAEMHQHNINVSTICPGYVKSDISINSLTEGGEQYKEMDPNIANGLSAELIADEVLKMVLLRRNQLVVAPFVPKAAIFCRNNLPNLYFRAIAKRAEKTKL